VSRAKPDQMSAPTPCTEFDTRTLINHVINSNYGLAESAKGNAPQFAAEPPDLVGQDPAGAYEQSANAVLAAFGQPGAVERRFQIPGVDRPGPELIRIALAETVLHRWDLARAIGQSTQIDPQVAEEVLATGKASLTDELRKGSFNPEVKIPDDAPVQDRLVAFFGRQP
jgi:uncharacterized protein (TIGR03086 family)